MILRPAETAVSFRLDPAGNLFYFNLFVLTPFRIVRFACPSRRCILFSIYSRVSVRGCTQFESITLEA